VEFDELISNLLHFEFFCLEDDANAPSLDDDCPPATASELDQYLIKPAVCFLFFLFMKVD